MYPPRTQSEEERRRTNETQFAALAGTVWAVVGGIALFASHDIFTGVLSFEIGAYCCVQAAQAHAGAKKKTRILTAIGCAVVYFASALLVHSLTK